MRILQGLIDIAGQPGQLAVALRQLGYVAESWVFQSHPFGYENDRILWPEGSPPKSRARVGQLFFTIEALARFDIWHLHKGYSFFHLNKDLRIAKQVGKKIFLHYRGREIRPFIGTQSLQEQTLERLGIQLQYANTVFVHDGELAELIRPLWTNPIVFPNIVKLPQCSDEPPETPPSSKLRVVHIPSNPELKGTQIIRDILSKYIKHIEYVELTRISHLEVIRNYKRADLVIDQLLIGTYGNASLEAMACGKPVICYLNPVFRKYEPQDLPIISADRETLDEKIQRALDDRAWLDDLGKAGKIYVQKRHSHEAVGKLAIQYYHGS